VKRRRADGTRRMLRRVGGYEATAMSDPDRAAVSFRRLHVSGRCVATILPDFAGARNCSAERNRILTWKRVAYHYIVVIFGLAQRREHANGFANWEHAAVKIDCAYSKFSK
jgi:hypothetical protein